MSARRSCRHLALTWRPRGATGPQRVGRMRRVCWLRRTKDREWWRSRSSQRGLRSYCRVRSGAPVKARPRRAVRRPLCGRLRRWASQPVISAISVISAMSRGAAMQNGRPEAAVWRRSGKATRSIVVVQIRVEDGVAAIVDRIAVGGRCTGRGGAATCCGRRSALARGGCGGGSGCATRCGRRGRYR